METKKASYDQMFQNIESEAWSNLSRDYHWNESLLEMYKDKVDWDEITSNHDIEWNVSMLEKFKDKINWKILSSTTQNSLLVPEILERFIDRWDWKELSKNCHIPIETIRKMADYIDWKELITYNYREDIYGMAFYKEFADRIPESDLKDSCLWHVIVEEKVTTLRSVLALS